MRRPACPLVLLVLLAAGSARAQPTTPPTVARLHSGWTLRSADGRIGPVPFAVPGMVHPALVRAGVIADPLTGDGERAAAWVDTTTWIAETTFDVPPGTRGDGSLALRFDALDTFADVAVNGARVATTDNAFRTWTVRLPGGLRRTGNRLSVRFSPTLREAERRAARSPMRYPESPRVFARTPQFRFGWDWGPRLVGAGLPRPVRLVDLDGLHAADVRADLRHLSDDRAEIDVTIAVARARSASSPVELRLTLDGRTVATRTLAPGGSATDPGTGTATGTDPGTGTGTDTVRVPLRIDRPRRWEPVNSGRTGRPHLYRLGVELRAGGETWTHAQPLGLRTVALDTAGGAMAFVVNGHPVYAKGANVIPVEVFYPASRARTRQVLTSAVDAGMNLVRVWGGGHYEDDAFYEIADSLGLLVWQDVAFASAFYPHEATDRSAVAGEVLEHVRRLRAHPSLVVWCGGNEVREGWHNWGWQRALGLSPADSATMWDRYEAFVEGDLARLVAREGGGVPYWPNSPTNGWGRAVAYERGDVHYWGVWWGRAPFETYRTRVGRFHSEYGMQAYPAWATVRAFADTLAEANPTFRRHQKHPTGFETLRHYALQTFAQGDTAWVDALRARDLPAYAFLTQAMQAEGIALALDAHRASAPRTMGSLVWQLNDVWPVVSWAMVDAAGRPKPLWHRARRLHAPVFATLRTRPDTARAAPARATAGADPARATAGGHVGGGLVAGLRNPTPGAVTELGLSHDGPRPRRLRVTTEAFDGRTGARRGRATAADVALPAGPAVVWAEVGRETLCAVGALDSLSVVHLVARDATTGAVLLDTRLHAAPAWHVGTYDPALRVRRDGRTLVLTAARPALGVWLETPGGDVLPDNYVDVWPGTPRRVGLPPGVDARTVRVRSLHDLRPRR